MYFFPMRVHATSRIERFRTIWACIQRDAKVRGYMFLLENIFIKRLFILSIYLPLK